RLIHKTHYQYDRWGNPCQEEHFGSDDKLAYALQRTYNERGDLLSETNPLQEVALYEYDGRGRCVRERPFSNGLVIQRTFDEKGRLILLQEGDGLRTTYTYDALRRPKKKTVGRLTALFEYDGYQLCSTTDPAGFVTTYTYNLAGQKIEEARAG